MSSRPLDDLLKSLRSEIHSLDIDDADARRRLEGLVADIGSRSASESDASADEKLTGQLKASILKFEATHPRLAAVMNDVLEKLSAMGI
ncbi:MAG: DUF4404 family protein [Caldimonas sp.]